jgi:hypothetical protein
MTRLATRGRFCLLSVVPVDRPRPWSHGFDEDLGRLATAMDPRGQDLRRVAPCATYLLQSISSVIKSLSCGDFPTANRRCQPAPREAAMILRACVHAEGSP